MKDGIVTVTGKGAAPFLGVAVGTTDGPATVDFRARCAKGGDGKIEWLNHDAEKKDAIPQSAPFKLKGGDWQDVSVSNPPTGPLGVVRFYVPAQAQPVEIDWIDIRGTGAKKRWKF